MDFVFLALNFLKCWLIFPWINVIETYQYKWKWLEGYAHAL